MGRGGRTRGRIGRSGSRGRKVNARAFAVTGQLGGSKLKVNECIGLKSQSRINGMSQRPFAVIRFLISESSGMGFIPPDEPDRCHLHLWCARGRSAPP